MIPLSVMAEGISGMENGIADYRAAGRCLRCHFSYEEYRRQKVERQPAFPPSARG
jgi:hypothetical protein